jgi:paraquat-inducible protein B
MPAQPNYFKTGLFVLAAFALLAGALLFLGADRMFRPRAYFETYVDGSVQGIDVGSPVKFRGVTIGRISEIDFTFNQYPPSDSSDGRRDYVMLVMEVDKQAFGGMLDGNVAEVTARAVDEGLRVMLQPQGITGVNYAELDYVPAANRTPPLHLWWIPVHPYIPSAPGTLTSMLDSINSIMDSFKSLDLKDTLDKLDGALGAATSTLRKFSGDLDRMELAKVSDDLRGLLTDLRSKVNQIPVEQLSEDGQRMMKTLSSAASDAESLVDRLQASPLLNRAAAASIMGDVETTARNMRVLSENLRNQPSLLFFGRPPKTQPSGAQGPLR